MKRLVLLVLVACGGAQHPDDVAPAPAPAAAAPRSPIERRRDAACDALGPRITACAVEDARADLTAGKIGKADFDRDTAPDIRAKNTEKFVDECKSHAYSSRQVRVLEVCPHDETQCEPLLACLGHLSDAPPP